MSGTKDIKNKVVLTENTMQFERSHVQIITGKDVDPTSEAVDGRPGDLLISVTGQHFIKNDMGVTTNWSQVGSGGGGGVTEVSTGNGLTGGPITSTGTIELTNTGVSPGTYTSPTVTVDAQGRVTSASNGSAVTTYPAVLVNGQIIPTTTYTKSFFGGSGGHPTRGSSGGAITTSNDNKYIVAIIDLKLNIYEKVNTIQNDQRTFNLVGSLNLGAVNSLVVISNNNEVTSLAISPDNKYIAIGLSLAPFFSITTVESVINGSAIGVSVTNSPGIGAVKDIQFGAGYIAVGHAGTRGLAIYQKVTLPNSPTSFKDRNYTGAQIDFGLTQLVTGQPGSVVRFTPDQSYLVVGSAVNDVGSGQIPNLYVYAADSYDSFPNFRPVVSYVGQSGSYYGITDLSFDPSGTVMVISQIGAIDTPKTARINPGYSELDIINNNLPATNSATETFYYGQFSPDGRYFVTFEDMENNSLATVILYDVTFTPGSNNITFTQRATTNASLFGRPILPVNNDSVMLNSINNGFYYLSNRDAGTSITVIGASPKILAEIKGI